MTVNRSISPPSIVNPNSTKPGLGSPIKTVTKIKVVNTTDGTDPNKALLKEFQESAPNLQKDYSVTVDNQGGVTVSLNGQTRIL